MSLRQLSPACCGRRLPRRRQSPARSRRAVGCMSSSRLYSPPPPAPRPRRSPRPQLSRSRHAKLLAGNKRLRSGRAGASPPPPRRAARSPAARCKCWAGERLSSPFPAPPRRAAPPGQPPWKPGSATRRAKGRRAEAEPRRGQGKGATRAEEEGAAERIGGRGGGGGASARFRAWEPRRQPLGSPSPRPPRPRARGRAPPPREGERRGAAPARGSAEQRKSPDKGKPRPPPAGPTPLPPPPRPDPPGSQPSPRASEPRRDAPPPPASGFWQGPLGAPSARGVVPAAAGGTHRSRLQLYHQRLS